VLLHAALLFGFLALVTTAGSMFPRVIRARIWFGLPFGVVLLAIGTAPAIVLSHAEQLDFDLAATVVVVALLVRLTMRRWSWVGAQLFAAVTLASLAYLLYAGSITYAVARSPIYLFASTMLLLLEVAALSLSLSYLFEIVDTLSRAPDAPIPFDASYLPQVAVQVPAYNEPLEVIQETLKALAALDYPNLVVQVVDNNTPDPANWQAVEAECKKLGDRFQFMHLENWPGFKAGALNEATRRLPKEVELIGVVDSDYVVKPDWLRSVVGHFADPKTAFVQTPQNYRDWSDNRYLRGLYYSYQYFFEITMPARAYRNAIIFAGTMGVMRRGVLDEIGGWNTDVVTEDAEASLRMLARGYLGIYEPRAFGHGLMPLTFDGLKKQRFRWALGGVQILRLHWRRLILQANGERLTRAQRVHYLLGNVQWFGDVLLTCFSLLLLATAVSIAMHHQLPVRSMTGLALGLPIAFLASGLLRAVWAMKLKVRCSWGDAIAGLQVWFALSWVVTLACVRGLIRFHSAFLRTPKLKDAQASIFKAFRAAQTETFIALVAFLAALAMLIRVPSFSTIAIAVLLLFQASVYTNAIWAGAAAEGIHLTPLRRAYRNSAQSTGLRPGRVEMLAVPTALVMTALALFILLSSATPTPPTVAENPLPNIQLGPVQTAPTPSPSPSPSASPTASPSPVSSASPSSSPKASAAPTPSASPSPSPSP
jgi:cellulose synthase/poly-beta-1,6-N-acetylglucosamine synthase-like glycosyltransferase